MIIAYDMNQCVEGRVGCSAHFILELCVLCMATSKRRLWTPGEVPEHREVKDQPGLLPLALRLWALGEAAQLAE